AFVSPFERETPQEDTPAETPEAAAAQAPPREIERVVEKRGGFGAALLGGVVAAGIGFVAGQSGWLDSVLPPSLQGSSADLAALRASQSEMQAALASLQQQLEGSRAPDLAPLSDQADALAAEIAALKEAQTAQAPDEALRGDLEALAGRVSALETRPLEGATPEAVAAFEAELGKLQDSLAAQRAEIDQKLAEAEDMETASAEAARIASAQTQLAQLRSALDSGNSYDSNVQQLELLGVEVPSALSGPAETGVATLTALRDGFAPAAREALAAAREEAKGGGSLMDYVNRHLGARSVAPRDGDDPDAILSRAEAAVAAGRIEEALTEVSALPETARAALSGWEAAANARVAAVNAAADLAQSLQAK
ncbi:hypothetical protein, partial [Leisingera aquaemixtae]